MDFEQLQGEMNAIIEDVKKAIDLPIDAEGKMPSGAHLTLEDLEKLLERTQGVMDKLNEKATTLAEKNGMSREEMAKYIENPANFSPQEWEAMQAMKKQVDQFQKLLMRTVIAGQEPKQAATKPSSPGLTKRNWIPL